MWKKDEITGVKEHDGFEFQIDGIKFNAYKGKDGIVHIIEPETGRSILQYDYLGEMDDLPSELEMVTAARDRLAGEHEKLTILKEKKGTESYRLMSLIFKAYKRGANLEKRLKEELERIQTEEAAGQ